ncbi:MAG: glucose-6-phosphate dehydrogenase assembly protein OpcA [Candidatus Limnocylindrales bacterium]
MAGSAGNGRIEGIAPGEQARWQVRTTSIAETIQELSRIWGVVAQRVAAGPSERARAHHRGDRRVAAHLAEAEPEDTGSLKVRTRTSVLTLIVVADTEETRARATAAVTALAGRHPSRAIILAPGDPDGPATFEARIDAACQVPPRGTTEICTEEIVLRLGGELAQHLSSTIAPLTIHDLPAVLWWPDDAPFDSPVFVDLAEECDRVLVDSGGFRRDGVASMLSMAEAVAEGYVVHDIAWMRLELWRELLAGLFDHPLLQPELRRLTSIRVDVARPGSVTRLTRAALFVGWMAAMLDWQVEQPLQQDADGSYQGILKSGRRQIPVELRPVGTTIDGPVRGTGSLVRVDLEASRVRTMLRVRVTRQSDHLLATADWNGAPVARRPARLEAFDETPFLAEALDRTGHDPVFELALERAVRLTSALVPPAPGTAPRTGASPAGTA